MATHGWVGVVGCDDAARRRGPPPARAALAAPLGGATARELTRFVLEDDPRVRKFGGLVHAVCRSPRAIRRRADLALAVHLGIQRGSHGRV
jgi:hypothetical protein